MKRQFCFLLLFLSSFHFSQSQLPALKFRHYTTENGFPAKRVQQVIQDKYGFIWFDAEKYLVRHNGTEFKIYRHEEKDSLSLPESRFYDIFCGANGLFLVGCEK